MAAEDKYLEHFDFPSLTPLETSCHLQVVISNQRSIVLSELHSFITYDLFLAVNTS